MYYEKNQSPVLEEGLFQNPTSEYRGAPFWAWNTKLEMGLLSDQLDCFKRMGFGGAHLHPRTGLDTPYLSEEFMGYIQGCVEKAGQEGMYVYLYDEDRWPSGFAGGLVTKDEQYRAQYLLFTPFPYGSVELKENNIAAARGSRTEKGTLLAVYDIRLQAGELESYRMIDKEASAAGTKWYAYLERMNESPWYNNQTYVDTLSKKAIDKFIEITYESYFNAVGDSFGKLIPSIFTDEPQFSHKNTLHFPDELTDVILPWTADFPETFREAYWEEIMERLPELVWEKAGGASTVRYHYHDHVTERFTEAFADNCGSWCREHGLMLTGHMMEEPTLKSQTSALGEAMRAFRGFDLPGIDMLGNSYEYTTAKQAQSASHQFGCCGVLSELYGVTSWSFDFRMHKLQGDWQAALGVTTRVPHLSMASMKGESKRDYPASINYQSPWHEEYRLVEDHFARVNTAMTRGKADVRIGVIHPIESYWLHWGPTSQTGLVREQLDENFRNLTEWLLFGGYDFDFIDESLLPQLCHQGTNPFTVGKMSYDAVIIPGCETLRGTTVKRLEEFSAAGGTLLIMGQSPSLIDAKANAEIGRIFAGATRIPFERSSLLTVLEPYRTVKLEDRSGALTDCLLYQLRKDTDCSWLFIAQGKPLVTHDRIGREPVRITVAGSYQIQLYDTLTGSIQELPADQKDGKTVLTRIFHNHDSLLLKLIPEVQEEGELQQSEIAPEGKPVRIKNRVPVTLSEPNVLLLDQAEFALDNGEYQPRTEILRLDNQLRKILQYPPRQGEIAQPWTRVKAEPVHHVRLRFAFESRIGGCPVSVALEDAKKAKLTWNGSLITSVPEGYYTDRCIGVISLGKAEKGMNILEIQLPYDAVTDLEWCYLLGDFGVEVQGDRAVLTEPVRELSFGDITSQGLPFYGGNITYHIPVAEKESCTVQVPHYRGALVTAEAEGRRIGTIAFAPYQLELPELNGTLDLKLFGNRVNTFGAVHLVTGENRWLNPNSWRTTGDGWSDTYVLEPVGILSAPVVRRRN